MTSEPLWTVDDVAAFLKVSKAWVYKRASSGELPCRHLGGLRRFEPAAIRRYIQGERAGSVVPLVQSSSPGS
jgi:excisionase family DNA binding protein